MGVAAAYCKMVGSWGSYPSRRGQTRVLRPSTRSLEEPGGRHERLPVKKLEKGFLERMGEEHPRVIG